MRQKNIFASRNARRMISQTSRTTASCEGPHSGLGHRRNCLRLRLLTAALMLALNGGTYAPIMGTVAAGALWMAAPRIAHAGRTPNSPSEITCTGDLSSGVQSGPAVPPADFLNTAKILNVNTLSGVIQPSSGTSGINFSNDAGRDVTVKSGTSGSSVVIHTNNAAGIVAGSQGTPNQALNDTFLGIPIPGDPAVAGGVVEVNSFANIQTAGNNAHGIAAQSSTTGYPASVTMELNAFLLKLEPLNTSGISFSVLSVKNKKADGSPGTLGEPVVGVLIDMNGNPITGDGGTFTLNADGTFNFIPPTDLILNETRRTTVQYMVHGTNASIPPSFSDVEGTLVVIVTKQDSAGLLKIVKEAYFDVYGVSVKPATGTVLPDLKSYVKGLLAKASAGGSGNSVTVTSKGDIKTLGATSHGIFAQSLGGGGPNGRGGSISHGSDQGGPGNTGGTVSVTADGSITTTGDKSAGIAAQTQGGNGGQGGDGGTFRFGSQGGTGGKGGNIEVRGSATIHTSGNSSSGIIALSQGGNGGNGGSGEFVTGGASGGYGGQAGLVVVDGSWEIKTKGDKAHGIWAKSLGGNAGAGGSGGWLAGSPGGGGQGADGGTVKVTPAGESSKPWEMIPTVSTAKVLAASAVAAARLTTYFFPTAATATVPAAAVRSRSRTKAADRSPREASGPMRSMPKASAAVAAPVR